jgi:outer membrane murein-binding lipoprotein Lpp
MTWYYCLALAAPWAVTWVSLHSLHRKVNSLMSDVQTLSDTLDAIATDVSAVASEVTDLEAKITELQAEVDAGNPVDLTEVLAKASAIRSSLESITTTASGPVPTPTPAPSDTPPADNSGQLGDGSGTLG